MSIDLEALAQELSLETGASLATTREGVKDVLEGRDTPCACAVRTYAEILGYKIEGAA